MKSLKIGTKIIIGFANVFILLLIIAVTAVSFTAFTRSNVERMETYVGLQSSANELMHILNETRVTASAFYATHSAATFSDVSKQLLYCDLRLKKLYEYLDANPAANAFRPRVESFEALYVQWRDGIKAFAAVYDFAAEFTPEQEEAFAASSTELRKINLLAHEILSNMDTDVGDIAVKQTNQTKETGVYSLTIVIAISVAALFVAIGISYFLIRSITGPIGRMRDVLSRIGEFGDLRISEDEIEILETLAAGKDETAQCTSALMLMVRRLHEIDRTLSHVADGDLTVDARLQSERDTIGLAVEKMLTNLRQKFGTIAESTGQVNMRAKALSEDSQLLESGAQEQAVSIANLSDSVTRVRQKAEENSGLARKAAALTSSIQSNAHVGSEKMSQMIRATADINEASRAIGKVLRAIEDIAFQTNILALNAAVEAAHAGQHGKGFAVVADEVRSLATKCAAAAKETSELIENTMLKAELGASIAEETSDSLREIVRGVEDSGAIMSGISDLSKDQSDEILQIVENVGQVERIVGQNSAIASRSASAATDISSQSDMLHGLIEQFKLDDPDRPRLLSGKT